MTPATAVTITSESGASLVIETWEALRFDRTIGTGRTKPLVIECARGVRDDHERRSLVVKARSLPEVTESGMFCELIGNLLARDFGIDTPAPGLVTLSSDFVEVANHALRNHGLRLEPGFGVGCELLPKGFTSPILGSALSEEELPQAALIYGYDLIVQNPDRHPRNPNLLTKGGRLVAIDFNLAFSFIVPVFGKQPEPWELSQHRFNHEHLFKRGLRNRKVCWQPVIEGAKRMKRARIERLCASLPSNWQTWTGTICDHLMNVKDNASKLEMELQRSLS
jgi:hypothetical protein